MASDPARVDAVLRAALRDVIGGDPARVAGFAAGTRLFGALPELDSMAAAGLLGELEERLGINVDDIDGDDLASFGSLLAYLVARAGR